MDLTSPAVSGTSVYANGLNLARVAQFPLNTTLSGPHSRYGRCWRKNSVIPAGIQTPDRSVQTLVTYNKLFIKMKHNDNSAPINMLV